MKFTSLAFNFIVSVCLFIVISAGSTFQFIVVNFNNALISYYFI